MKFGIIQTRGIGDVVIAIPIALHLIELGHEVFWPLDGNFFKPFKLAFPQINFIPLSPSIAKLSKEYFYLQPKVELEKLNCEKIFCLYSFMSNNFNFGQTDVLRKIAQSLKFDEYKYAITNTPFYKKWKFEPIRNYTNELQLAKILRLSFDEKYIVVHDQGSDFKAQIEIDEKYQDLRCIKISTLTDNFFDWMSILENAEKVYMVDSVYSNLIEQMDLVKNKRLYLRSNCNFTPVYKNIWEFV